MARLDRLLIVREDRLGDVCVSLSVLEALRRESPETRVIWVGKSVFRQIVEGQPNVSEYWEIPEPFGSIEQSRFVEKIRGVKPDAALLLKKNSSTEWGGVLAKSGVPVRVGAVQGGRFFRRLTHNTYQPGLEWHQKHEARKALDMLAVALGRTVSDTPSSVILLPEIRATVLGRLRALELPDAYFVVQLGTGGSNRQVSPSFFGRVTKCLHSEFGLTPVLTGLESERALDEEFLAAYGGPAVRLSGRTDVGELSELVRRARFVLSVDTGTVHVAAAVQTPSVDIMPKRSVSPKQWSAWMAPTIVIRPGRFCEGCTEWKCRSQASDCIETVSEQATFEACVGVVNHRTLKGG